MNLLSLFNPETAYSRVSAVIKDIRNYIFYREQIKKIEASGILAMNRMRVDWLKRVYYVVNLEPETLMAADAVELEKSRVFESVSKIQTTLMDHNLFEIIEVSTKRIKTQDYYAYLIWVKYKSSTTWAKRLSLIWYSVVIFFLVKLGLLIYSNADQIKDNLVHVFTVK